MMTIVLVVMLGSCVRPAETQEPMSAEMDTTASEPVVAEGQRPTMTDEELIELLEQIDAGNNETVDFEQYRGAQLPTPTMSRWIREKQQENRAYHSGGMSIPRTGDTGWFNIAALADRAVFFYSRRDGDSYRLSDWLIVEKENTLVTIQDLAAVSDPSSLIGERVEYSFGLEHWDFETDPLVYDQWFHPDAIIRIDPDAGTLELIEEVPADQYIMIEGV